MIPGTKDAYRLCMVPEQSPTEVKKSVANGLSSELSRQLRDYRIRTLLKDRVRAARGKDIDSDSYDCSSEEEEFLDAC